jgi:hypothetical protein
MRKHRTREFGFDAAQRLLRLPIFATNAVVANFDTAFIAAR